MIWPKVPGIPKTGYSGVPASQGAVERGVFMYVAGEFETAHAALGTPGYSKLGDIRMLVASNQTVSGYGAFPVDKLIMQLEDADQDLDTIASGKGLIYYEGGEYETDVYNGTASGTGVKKGDKLYLDANGKLTTTAVAGWSNVFPIAWVRNVSDFPATNRWFNGGNTSGVDSYKKTLWYVLYPQHAAPMYNGGVIA